MSQKPYSKIEKAKWRGRQSYSVVPQVSDAPKTANKTDHNPILTKTGISCSESGCNESVKEYPDELTTQQRSSWQAAPPKSCENKRQVGRRLNPTQAQHYTTVTDRIARQLDTIDVLGDPIVDLLRAVCDDLRLFEKELTACDKLQQLVGLDNVHYRRLIKVYASGLNAYCDFFIIIGHPFAGPVLRQAVTCDMPTVMCQYAIHSLLEQLQYNLPGSLEHIMTFINIAIPVIAFLYETVTTSRDTWAYCLGDLWRHRADIAEEDDRETYMGVAKYWYSKAHVNELQMERPYSQLTILTQTNALQQFLAKSFCVQEPLLCARESIAPLLDSFLDPSMAAAYQHLHVADAAFMRVFGILFCRKAMDEFEPMVEIFLGLLGEQMCENWMEAGYHMGISLGCLLMDFGKESNPLRKAILRTRKQPDQAVMRTSSVDYEHFSMTLWFVTRTLTVVMKHRGREQALPFLHTMFVILLFMTRRPRAVHLDGLPWNLLVEALNHLMTSAFAPKTYTDEFPGLFGEPSHILPEDYAMRGLIYADDYFPHGWFEHVNAEGKELLSEQCSHSHLRCERTLWLGRKIAAFQELLVWDAATRKFSVPTIKPPKCKL